MESRRHPRCYRIATDAPRPSALVRDEDLDGHRPPVRWQAPLLPTDADLLIDALIEEREGGFGAALAAGTAEALLRRMLEDAMRSLTDGDPETAAAEKRLEVARMEQQKRDVEERIRAFLERRREYDPVEFLDALYENENIGKALRVTKDITVDSPGPSGLVFSVGPNGAGEGDDLAARVRKVQAAASRARDTQTRARSSLRAVVRRTPRRRPRTPSRAPVATLAAGAETAGADPPPGGDPSPRPGQLVAVENHLDECGGFVQKQVYRDGTIAYVGRDARTEARLRDVLALLLGEGGTR